MFKISGVLTTMSGLNIAAPGENYVTIDGRHCAKGEGFPVTRTRHQMFAGNAFPAADLLEEDGNSDGKSPVANFYVPMIPANSLRGRIREAAARIYYEVLAERGELLTPGAYNVLQCGAATGNPDVTPRTFEETLEAANDPYFGLLGGGARMSPSSLRVDELFAITEKTLPYIRAKNASRFVNSGSMTNVAFKRRLDALMMLADVEGQARIIADYEQSIKAYHDDNDERVQAAKAKAAKDAKAKADKLAGKPTEKPEEEKIMRSVQAFTAVESVIPGVHFGVSFDIKGDETKQSTLAQLGLFLVALQALVKKQQLGGMGQIGFGRFRFSELLIHSDEHPEGVPAFSQVEDDLQLPNNDLVVAAMDAWADKRSLVSAALIERMATSKAAPAKKAEK